MGSVPVVLNASAQWTQVLGAVGVPVPGGRLPARARCPLCHGSRLTIYEDSTQGGAWHYCFACNDAGDMIDLAATYWKVGPEIAARRLADVGMPLPASGLTLDGLKASVTAPVEWRRKVAELWTESQTFSICGSSRQVARLQSLFRLTGHLTPDRWKTGPGRIVGANTRAAIERVFCPAPDARAFGKRRYGPLPGAVFRGKDWDEVLVVPHYDLPERICGFLFVGRDGGLPDRVYQTVTAIREGSSRANALPHEGGLSGLWAAYASPTGPHVVACGDPFLAARLQIRHYTTAAAPLPLVAFHDSPGAVTKSAWKALSDKVPVLWGWELTPSLVYQAIVSDGRLSITPLPEVTQHHIDRYLRMNEPRAIVQRAIRQSRPWSAALAEWADKATDKAIGNLLLSLEGYGVPAETIVAVSDRFAEVYVPPAEEKTCPTVTAPTYMVVERDGRWYGRERLAGCKSWREEIEVFSGTLRIRSVVRRGVDLVHTAVMTHEGVDGEIVFKTRNRIGFNLYIIAALTEAGSKVAPRFAAGVWLKRLRTLAEAFSVVKTGYKSPP